MPVKLCQAVGRSKAVALPIPQQQEFAETYGDTPEL
jgi:hypothetical protein